MAPLIDPEVSSGQCTPSQQQQAQQQQAQQQQQQQAQQPEAESTNRPPSEAAAATAEEAAAWPPDPGTASPERSRRMDSCSSFGSWTTASAATPATDPRGTGIVGSGGRLPAHYSASYLSGSSDESSEEEGTSALARSMTCPATPLGHGGGLHGSGGRGVPEAKPAGTPRGAEPCPLQLGQLEGFARSAAAAQQRQQAPMARRQSPRSPPAGTRVRGSHTL
jgi:hypothetical protein